MLKRRTWPWVVLGMAFGLLWPDLPGHWVIDVATLMVGIVVATALASSLDEAIRRKRLNRE